MRKRLVSDPLVAELTKELWMQWSANHCERCRDDEYHEGECFCPMPDILKRVLGEA